MSSNAVAIGLVRVTKVLVVVAGLGVSGDTHGRHSVEKRKRHGASSPVRLAASGETAQRAPHRYKSDRLQVRSFFAGLLPPRRSQNPTQRWR
jgi:hypothetical protein